MKYAKKFIGDKNFYKMALTVAVPIMVQNGITNFVSMLDNIMVGRIGTEQMSGVAIVNQLLFVFNISIFGAVSGAGIFGAQFWGCGKQEGVQHTFRFKWIVSVLLVLLAGVLFFVAGDDLIMLYLHGEENEQQILATLEYAQEYLRVMFWGLLPFGICQVYTSTLRECGETMLPMKAGIVAVVVNMSLNYVLIFGKLGMPQLGVSGAAIATVVSRYVETAVVIFWTHTHKEKQPYIEGVYKKFYIPRNLTGKILIKGTPLMLNEILWSVGMAVLMQCYSVRGLDAVAGLNISSTISNVFNVVYIAMGSAVSIIVGQLLGAGKMEEAKDTDTKLIFFSVASCFVLGALLVAVAPLFPLLYNTTNEVRALATSFIRIVALCMPLYAFVHCAYFTLRSGGRTMITFLFDSVFVWVISIPFAFVLSRFTDLPVVPLYFTCQSLEAIKCVIGFILIKKGIWIQNIIKE